MGGIQVPSGDEDESGGEPVDKATSEPQDSDPANNPKEEKPSHYLKRKVKDNLDPPPILLQIEDSCNCCNESSLYRVCAYVYRDSSFDSSISATSLDVSPHVADLGDAQDDYPEYFQKAWAKAGSVEKNRMVQEAPCHPSQTLYRKLSIDSIRTVLEMHSTSA